jgi:multidrug efflux pump subunit AcrA (membrane-fusion protein)
VRSPVVAKKSAKRRVLVLVLILVGLIAIIVGVIGRPQTNLAASLLTEPVTKGDVAITVSASGTLVDEYTYSIAPETTAVLSALDGVAVGGAANAVGYHTTWIAVSPGDAVVAGQQISEARNADDDAFAVVTPANGFVRSVTTAVGAVAGQVATIGAGAELVSVNVSEHDVAKVAKDQTVSVTLGATKEVFTGTVRSIGQLADSTAGVQQYQVIIASDNYPADARIGMSATASIEISSAKNVLYVPASAITTVNKQSTVKVLENGRLRLATVTLGVVGDSRVEIKSGLTEGDVVVTGSSGTVPVVSNTGRFGQGGGN